MYIIGRNFKSGFYNWVYYNEDSDNIISSYKPHFAKTFEDVSSAYEYGVNNIKEFLDESSHFNYEIIDRDEHIKLFEEYLKTDMVINKFKKLDPQFNRRYNGESSDEVLKYRIDTCHQNNVNYKTRQTWPQLWSIFENIWEVSGNVYGTDEKYVKMYVKNDKASFEKFKEEFEKVKLLPLVDENGFRSIDIFEHTCSEHGCYHFIYNLETDTYNIDMVRYRRNVGNLIKGNPTLEMVFDYWKRKVYYEDYNE